MVLFQSRLSPGTTSNYNYREGLIDEKHVSIPSKSGHYKQRWINAVASRHASVSIPSKSGHYKQPQKPGTKEKYKVRFQSRLSPGTTSN